MPFHPQTTAVKTFRVDSWLPLQLPAMLSNLRLFLLERSDTQHAHATAVKKFRVDSWLPLQLPAMLSNLLLFLLERSDTQHDLAIAELCLELWFSVSIQVRQ